ncbi:CHAT domain-containing protein [Micromonospora sp. PPF5-17]|uniref:CHAT domain-containing protein n=1 Tax=Micromonospora solifontis TaxID=2487138 RepID=A0ABX9WAG7_9ACTN|nr:MULTISPECIES: CHAT domain-containing protein [Micromonospora]NES39788.1 CHAT domain-containing protein [Micromonospora solifontis]NES58086.1 CHAT domain-containing protein [Micromonospora sp. PPF5-6]RNL85402.1 CHAT domain-containing protein [Micromonospora solifontis]
MWQRFRSDPVRRLRERLDDFGAGRDPRRLFEAGAARDAEAVIDLVTATAPAGPLPERTAEGLFLLACLHWYRYQLLPAGQDADDLAQAVKLTELLLHAAPGRVPPSLLAMYRAYGRAADRGRVPRSRAPEPAPDPAGGDPAALAAQAVVLMSGAERTGRYEVADRAEALLRRAVDATPAGRPERATYLSMLGRVHRDQFRQLGRPRALPAAVDAHRESLESTPAGDPQRPTRLFNLGNVLSDRYETDRDPAALDEAITLLREAAQAASVDPAMRAMAQANLGQQLRHRWRLHGRPADLDEAIDVLRPARRGGDPRTAALHGIVLSERFLRDRSPADRDAGIDAYRAALHADDQLDPAFVGPAWGGLATLLEDRYRADESAPGAGEDLDAAVEAYRAAAEATGDDTMRHHLGVLCTLRYERHRRPDELTEAVRLLRAGVAAADDPVVRGHRLADLGYALSRGHADAGGLDALRAACEALAEATTLLPPGDPVRHRTLNNLGNALRERADQGGDPALLEPAAEALRAALAEAPPDTPARPRYRANLGLVLQARFTVTQDLATLTEAVAVLAGAVEAAPPGHPDRPGALINYGSALNRRAELAFDDAAPAGREAARRDAAAAIAALREAVTLVDPADPVAYGQSVGTLAVALIVRHRLGDDDPAFLDEAVDLLDRLARSAPLRSADRHRFLTNLGNALLLRHRATGTDRDAEAMLVAYRGAVDALPPEHPDRAMCLSNLATAVEAADPADRSGHARAALREATAVPAAPSLLRAIAAHRYAELAAAADDLPGALDGYATAIELIDLVAWHGMDPDDQTRLLGRFRGLATDAAAVAVALGEPRRAVELLEYGRGVLLTRAHDAGADLTTVRVTAPELADEFTAVQTALDGFLRPGAADPVPPPAGGPDPERRYALAERRRRLLTEIRALPGLDGFLRRPAFDALAADLGPVALVNVGERRSDALVVAAGDVTVVPLPEATPAELVTRAADFLTAVAVLTGQAPPVPEAEARRRAVAARAAVGRTLDWLWRAVAAPVLDAAVPAGGSGEWPRLWWCPTGLLTLLPLHAAAPLDGGPGVLDRVIPSYTAALRALARARRAVPENPAPVDRALVVSLPHLPGLPDLPGAEREAQLVRGHLPDGRSLSGAAATPAAVVAELPGHPVVHLSCHGRQDLRDPLRGRLALTGGPLQVRDLWRAPAASAALAVLSACETVRGGAALPDEVLTLGTAFQLAGFRQVVGALWSISDQVTVQLCADLYAALAVPGGIDPDRAAVALHDAVRRLRAALPGRADLWAAYAHLGP